MKNRLKEVRKEQGLNQTDFGKRIGLTQPAIAGYENGSRVPMDAVIVSICKEFNINEHWLRTGDGEMHVPLTLDEEIIEWIGSIQAFSDTSIQKRVARYLANMTDEGWMELEKFARAILDRE